MAVVVEAVAGRGNRFVVEESTQAHTDMIVHVCHLTRLKRMLEVEMEILGLSRHGKPLISRERAGSWDSKTPTMSF